MSSVVQEHSLDVEQHANFVMFSRVGNFFNWCILTCYKDDFQIFQFFSKYPDLAHLYGLRRSGFQNERTRMYLSSVTFPFPGWEISSEISYDEVTIGIQTNFSPKKQ